MRLPSSSHVTLAVNNTRRLFPPSRKVHELLSEGAIGAVRFLGYYDGAKYGWLSASGFAFGLRGTGKGVLLEAGAHVLDLVCWWLGHRPHVTAYVDDSFGGSEAVAKVSFTDGGARGEVHLSWLGKLRNGFRIEGEAGSIVGSVYDWHAVELTSRSGKRKQRSRRWCNAPGPPARGVKRSCATSSKPRTGAGLRDGFSEISRPSQWPGASL